jgi:hypothetical protein
MALATSALNLVFLGALLALPSAAVAQSSIEYGSVAEASTALRAKPGVVFELQNGWLIVNEGKDVTWSFPPRGHDAYPAVAKRVLVEDADGRFRVLTSIKCEASKDACDRLAKSYEELDKAMLKAAEEMVKKQR